MQGLADEVQLTGGQARVVDSLEDAQACLAEWIEFYSPQTALCWNHALLDRIGLAILLERRGVRAWNHDSLATLSLDERRHTMLSADMGISSTTYAVAETGTLAVFASPGSERLASLLPPVHVAVVEESQILPDLFDLFARLEPAHSTSLPTNVSLITGPSKTGDLELRLTTGVHGPRHWHVLVLRDKAAPN